MPYIGHCNCARTQISLAEKPANTVLCHCSNCKRAGGPFSVNYVVNLDDISIEDPTESLKTYEDEKTASGNKIQRKFCQNCGSPVITLSPMVPGKGFLKASLFDEVAPPAGEFFQEHGHNWVQIQQAQ